jgi:hypothetical protein
MCLQCYPSNQLVRTTASVQCPSLGHVLDNIQISTLYSHYLYCSVLAIIITWGYPGSSYYPWFFLFKRWFLRPFYLLLVDQTCVLLRGWKTNRKNRVGISQAEASEIMESPIASTVYFLVQPFYPTTSWWFVYRVPSRMETTPRRAHQWSL